MSELTIKVDYIKASQYVKTLEWLNDRLWHEMSREDVEKEQKVVKKLKDLLDKAIAEKQYTAVSEGEI